MASNMSPEMNERFKKLKMEIRSILVSANEGLTPKNLDKDFMELFGGGIPYKEFGFSSLFHLLDAMQDTVEAYQKPNGEVLLLPISTSETRHIESLIARQRKMPRVGRFGGLVQKPAHEYRGSQERREFVTKRLLNVALKEPPNFIRSTDLVNKYERTYAEMLDARDDFYCSMRCLFETKLAKYFEFKDDGRGEFSVRLKDAERETLLAAMSAANRPSTAPRPTADVKMAHATSMSLPPRLDRMRSQTQPDPNRLTQEAIKNSLATPVSIEERKRAASSAFPRGAASSFARAINNAAIQHANATPTIQLQSPTRGFAQVVAPPPTPIKVFDTAEFSAASPREPASVSSLPVTKAQPKVDLKHTSIDSDGFRENLRQLLVSYPGGIELQVIPAAYQSAFGERLVCPNGEKSIEKAIEDIVREFSLAFEVMEKNNRRYLVKRNRKPLVQYVAPKNLRSVQLQNGKLLNTPSPIGPWTKLSPNADQRGSACRRREQVSNNVTNMTGETSLDELRQGCCKALQLYPTIDYLDFGKVYKEATGKDLDLGRFGFLAMVDVVEAMPDLFILENSDTGSVLKKRLETGGEYKMEVIPEKEKPTNGVNGGAPKMELVKVAAEERMMKKLWIVIMSTPSKSVYLHDLPALYKQTTGKEFPNIDLDEFGLLMFEYEDLFSFEYDARKLKILAGPDWGCSD